MNKKQKILAIFTLSLVLLLLLGNVGKIQARTQTQAEGSSALDSDTNAPTNALEDVATMAVYPIVLGINTVLAKIGGTFFTFAGYLVDLALRLNVLVLKSPMVNTGWNIVLGFANLGFVLAIIIIAIATILRVQQYGAKNLLGKLIAAALLVNFSLMIAGVFLDSADVFTRFFNKQFGNASLSTKITKLIQPQTLSDSFSSGGQMGFLEKYSRTVLKLLDSVNPFYWAGHGEGLEKMMWGDNKSLTAGNWLMILASFFFGIIFTFLSVLTLLAVGTMLLIRYIYLGILLIVSPIVWLFWIFPGTSNLWGQWWKNFLRWTFFAPIMMFFLFLAINLMGSAPLSQPINQDAFQFTQQLQAKQQGLPIDLMKFGNMIVVLGLLIGGLIAANSMGIHGSKAFIGIAQGAGKWAMGAIGRSATGLATKPLRGELGQKITTNMQKSKFMPINRLGAALGSFRVEQSARLAKATEDRINSRYVSDKAGAMAWSTLNREEQVAMAKRLIKNRTMNLMSERDLKNSIKDKNTESVFKSYAAGNVYEDFEKAAGYNTAMLTGKDKTGKPISREAATAAFYSTYEPKEFQSLLRTRAVFKEDDKDTDLNIAGIIHTNPGAIAKIMPRLKTAESKVFNGKIDKIFNEEIDALIKKTKPGINIGAEIKIEKDWEKTADNKLKWLETKASAEDYEKLKQIHNARTRTLNKRATGEEMPPMSSSTT